ncbi:hypothetical protein [Paenibacillus sp. NPDC058071]|uniref:hypothetical protein n=1 Tax=Paenibacillus sp. NPDC058071 TaxID=3346326 RepID=UPI0036DE1420
MAGMRRIKLVAAAGVAAVIVFAVGCAGMGKRSPEEWLSLSVSGLAATDQYAFKGKTVVSAGGLTFTPRSFSGKVTDHNHIMAKTEDGKALEWSPAQWIEKINDSNKEVSIASNNDEGARSDTVKLRVRLDDASATAIWKKQLTEEMEAVAASVPIEANAHRDEWLKELERSKRELNAMLETLTVQSEFDVVIDKGKLVPLTLNEHSVFRYNKDKGQKEEKRDTAVEFDSFDGTPGTSKTSK